MALLQVLLPLTLGFTLALFPFLPLLVATLLFLPVSPEEPEDKDGGTVTVPYAYDVADASVVPTEVSTYAGSTLYLQAEAPSAIPAAKTGTPSRDDVYYNLAGQRVSKNARGILIVNGKLIMI